MSLQEWLAGFDDRCPSGYSITHQHPTLCPDCPGDEWGIFTEALRTAARSDMRGQVHQRAVRPLVRGRIEPKHVGLNYRRAIREGLLREISREQSNDEAGRNTNKWEPIYELRAS